MGGLPHSRHLSLFFVSHEAQVEMTRPSPRHVASTPTLLRRASRRNPLGRRPGPHRCRVLSQCPHHEVVVDLSVFPRDRVSYPKVKLARRNHWLWSPFFRKLWLNSVAVDAGAVFACQVEISRGLERQAPDSAACSPSCPAGGFQNIYSARPAKCRGRLQQREIQRGCGES